MKIPRSARGHFSNQVRMPIMTGGEIFADGTAIELVSHMGDPERLNLLFWDGVKGNISAVVQREGRLYKPAQIDRSILRELTMPTHNSPPGSTRELLAELCKLAVHFVGLPEKFAAIVGRVVLAGWIIRALPVAPALSITGPDAPRGNRLVQMLRSTCRHALAMSAVTGQALCSLPSGLELTLLISQPTLSNQVQNLLDVAGHRDRKILVRGALLDLYGVQVVHSESELRGGFWSVRSLEIPMIPGSKELPIFDMSVLRRIASDFQPRLLSYRFANYSKASTSLFDASRLTHSLRELAQSLAATTPDDAALQTELFALLKGEDVELRSANWVKFTTIAIESLIFACYERCGQHVYIGELTDSAQEIWRRRGVNTDVDAGAFGRRLRDLGFEPEKRDAKGVKLHLTDAVCRRAQQLAKDFSVPELEDGEELKSPVRGTND